MGWGVGWIATFFPPCVRHSYKIEWHEILRIFFPTAPNGVPLFFSAIPSMHF